jgi:hypothetical protein
VVKDDALELHVPAVRLLVDRAASSNVGANVSSFIYATLAIRPEHGAKSGHNRPDFPQQESCGAIG